MLPCSSAAAGSPARPNRIFALWARCFVLKKTMVLPPLKEQQQRVISTVSLLPMRLPCNRNSTVERHGHALGYNCIDMTCSSAYTMSRDFDNMACLKAGTFNASGMQYGTMSSHFHDLMVFKEVQRQPISMSRFRVISQKAAQVTRLHMCCLCK